MRAARVQGAIAGEGLREVYGKWVEGITTVMGAWLVMEGVAFVLEYLFKKRSFTLASTR